MFFFFFFYVFIYVFIYVFFLMFFMFSLFFSVLMCFNCLILHLKDNIKKTMCLTLHIYSILHA